MAFSEDMDYYSLLKIDPNATSEAIKRAYRKESIKYHPDKNTDPDIVAKFFLLTKAKDDLLDEEIRAKYDAQRVQKEQEQRRRELLDGRRRKMAEDLEQREIAGLKRKRYEEDVHAETRRIAEDGRRRREARQKLQKQAVADEGAASHSRAESKYAPVAELDRTIKVRLKCMDEPDDADIERLFGAYGKIDTIFKGKRKEKKRQKEFGEKGYIQTVYIVFRTLEGAQAAFADRRNISKAPPWPIHDISLAAAQPPTPAPTLPEESGNSESGLKQTDEEATMMRLKRAQRRRMEDLMGM